VPFHELSAWSQKTLATLAVVLPLTCWHGTETTDPAWQSAIITAIRPVARALSTAAPRAELYVNTAFTPGALYPNPTGPAYIGIDNHDYIAELQWAPGSHGNLVGTGTLHWDDCSPSCAGGTYSTVPVQITMSTPQQCTVQLYPQGLGNPPQAVQAKVFTTIGVFAIQGSLPPSINFGRILTGLTCSQPAS
jgi:hypothetical protein